MWKHILSLGLILTGISGYVFWTSQREHNTPQVAPSPSAVEQIFPRQESAEVPREDTEVPQEDTEVLHPAPMLRGIFTEEELASPDMQKLLAIFASPEYATFAEAGDYSADAYYGFLASQGLPWDRNAYYRTFQEHFQKHFLGETPEELEPQIRQTLLNHFAENDVEDPADMLQVVITEILADAKNRAWMMGRFPGREREFGNWVVDVMKEHLDAPSTDASAVVETEGSIFPTEVPPDERFLDAVSTESLEPPLPSPVPPELEDGDVLTESDIDIDSKADIKAEIRALLEPTFPEQVERLATEANFEKVLRDTFSPKRLNAAMQTLNRYGPEGGLRRLKKSDPELATQIERFIERNEKEDD